MGMYESLESMHRVNRILENKDFNKYLRKTEKYEEDREFCKHDMNHLLDVARIAMLMNLETEAPMKKEWVYAAALLHDIGRFVQYEDGTDHAEASADLAPEILDEAGFTSKEVRIIVEAIRYHRDKRVKEDAGLRGILYRADKASRRCFSCPVEARCDWKKKKKNLTLEI